MIAPEFTTRRDGSGAGGVYAGVRRGRLGLEGGWMIAIGRGAETGVRAETEAGYLTSEYGDTHWHL